MANEKQCFAIGMCVVNSMAAEDWGWDRHIWDIPMSWLPTVQKLNLSFQTLFSVSSSFTKLSLLWFCKRLVGAGSKGLYRTYYFVLVGAMTFVAVCCALFELISIFQCRYGCPSPLLSWFNDLLISTQANSCVLGIGTKVSSHLPE